MVLLLLGICTVLAEVNETAPMDTAPGEEVGWEVGAVLGVTGGVWNAETEATFTSEMQKTQKNAEIVDTMAYDNLTVLHLFVSGENFDWGPAFEQTLSQSAAQINAFYIGLAYVTQDGVSRHSSNIISEVQTFTETTYLLCQNSSLPQHFDTPTSAWYHRSIAEMASLTNPAHVRIHSICGTELCINTALIEGGMFYEGVATEPDSLNYPGSTRVAVTLGILGNSQFTGEAFEEAVSAWWGVSSFGCAEPLREKSSGSDSAVIGLSVVGAVCGVVLIAYLLFKVRGGGEKKRKKKKKKKSRTDSTAPDTEPHNTTHPDSETQNHGYDPYMPAPGTVAGKHSWEVHSNDGRPYYYNRVTGQSRWDTPTVMDPNILSATNTHCNTSEGSVGPSPCGESLTGSLDQ